jgi:BlaI family penicillinase repressor
LGKVQLEIMRVLWERGQATAREITDELSRTQPIAHSTVQTLLRKLEAKGAVTHDTEDRTFVFRPVYEETAVRKAAAHDLLSRVFGGSVYGLVSHLLRHEEVSPDEFQRLRRLIEEEKPQ